MLPFSPVPNGHYPRKGSTNLSHPAVLTNHRQLQEVGLNIPFHHPVGNRHHHYHTEVVELVVAAIFILRITDIPTAPLTTRMERMLVVLSILHHVVIVTIDPGYITEAVVEMGSEILSLRSLPTHQLWSREEVLTVMVMRHRTSEELRCIHRRHQHQAVEARTSTTNTPHRHLGS